LRNDGRIWVSKIKNDERPPTHIPEGERDYFLERKYPSFGNLAPRDIASRAAKEVCDAGYGRRWGKLGRLPGFHPCHGTARRRNHSRRYGNLFDMYQRITGENAYQQPMRIYPAPHYAMGGLWVDYNLQSNLPGLFVLGEANFSDHGANRLGASALMQGLAEGYFIIPYTIADYLARPLREVDVGPLNSAARAGDRSRHSTGCSISTAAVRSANFTANWAKSFGKRSAWPEANRSEGSLWSKSPPCAKSSGTMSEFPAPVGN
jgi:succinate dehydrogenase/fumarate reductase flavoprotein subunit